MYIDSGNDAALMNPDWTKYDPEWRTTLDPDMPPERIVLENEAIRDAEHEF